MTCMGKRLIPLDTLEWREAGRSHGEIVVDIFQPQGMLGAAAGVLECDASEGCFLFPVILLFLANGFWMEAREKAH